MKNIVFLLLVGLLMTPPLLAQNTVIALRQDVKTEFLNFKKKQVAEWDKHYKDQNVVLKPRKYLEKMAQLIEKPNLSAHELTELMDLAKNVQDDADVGIYVLIEEKPMALQLIMDLKNPQTIPMQEKETPSIAPTAKINQLLDWKWLWLLLAAIIGGIMLFHLRDKDKNDPNYYPEPNADVAHYLPSFFNFFRKKKKETPSVSTPNVPVLSSGNANNIGELPTKANETVNIVEKDKEVAAIKTKELQEKEALNIELANKQKELADKEIALKKQELALRDREQALEASKRAEKQAEKQLEKRKAAEIQAALRNKYQKGIESKGPAQAVKPMQTIENQDYSGRSFFLAGPNADGSFVNYNGSENFIPYTSMYRFTLNAEDETKAQFEFWNDPTSIHDALADQIGYLDPVSVGLNPHDMATKTIKTEKKGHAKLVGERWILEKKAEIIYE